MKDLCKRCKEILGGMNGGGISPDVSCMICHEL